MTEAQPLPRVHVRRPSLIAAAVFFNLALVVPLAYVLNIWQDEAYTIATTSRDFAFAFHQAIAFEQNAPLYFVMLTAWRHLGDSVFFLRLPSIAFATVAILLVPGIARRYVPTANAGYVTLAAAWNPFIVWAALEMRVYALVILLSALLLLTFYDAFLASRPTIAKSVAYAVCVAIALYVQYYLGFLVAAQGLTLLLYRPRAVLRFALCCATAAAAFAPMLAIVPAQVQNFATGFVRPTLLRSVAVLAGILMKYAFPLLFPHAKAIYLALAAGVVLTAVAIRRWLHRCGDGTMIVTTAFAFVLFAGAAYAGGVHILDRHASSLYLPAVVSVFAALTFVRLPVRERLMTAWCWAAIAASSVALASTYAPLAKPGDWVRLTAYLSQRERQNEPIVVFQAENALPFAYYYRGPNRVVAIPHDIDFRRYDVRRFVIHDRAEVERVMPHAAHLWLITAGKCTSADLAFGCGPLESFVVRRYRVDSDASFYGARLRRLSLKAS